MSSNRINNHLNALTPRNAGYSPAQGPRMVGGLTMPANPLPRPPLPSTSQSVPASATQQQLSASLQDPRSGLVAQSQQAQNTMALSSASASTGDSFRNPASGTVASAALPAPLSQRTSPPVSAAGVLRNLGPSRKRVAEEMEEEHQTVDFAHDPSNRIETRGKRRRVEPQPFSLALALPHDLARNYPNLMSASSVEPSRGLHHNSGSWPTPNPRDGYTPQPMSAHGFGGMTGAQHGSQPGGGFVPNLDAGSSFNSHPQNNQGFESMPAAQHPSIPGLGFVARTDPQTNVPSTHPGPQNMHWAPPPPQVIQNTPSAAPHPPLPLHSDKRVIPSPTPWNDDEKHVLADQGEKAFRAEFSADGRTCWFILNGQDVKDKDLRLLCFHIPSKLALNRLFSQAHLHAMGITRYDHNVTYLYQSPDGTDKNNPHPIRYNGPIVVAKVSSASTAKAIGHMEGINLMRQHLHTPDVKQQFRKVQGHVKGVWDDLQIGFTCQPHHGKGSIRMSKIAQEARKKNAETDRAAAAGPQIGPVPIKSDWLSYTKLLCDVTAMQSQLARQTLPGYDLEYMEWVWNRYPIIPLGARSNHGFYSAGIIHEVDLNRLGPHALDQPNLTELHPGDAPALYSATLDLSNPNDNQTLGNEYFTDLALLIPRQVGSTIFYNGRHRHVHLGHGIIDTSLPSNSAFREPPPDRSLTPLVPSNDHTSLSFTLIQKSILMAPKPMDLHPEFFEDGFCVNVESKDQQVEWCMKLFLCNEAEYRCRWFDIYGPGVPFLWAPQLDGMRFLKLAADRIEMGNPSPSAGRIAETGRHLHRLTAQQYSRMFPYLKDGQWAYPDEELARKTLHALENPNAEYERRTADMLRTIPTASFKNAGDGRKEVNNVRKLNNGLRGNGAWVNGDVVPTHEGLDISQFDPATDLVPGNPNPGAYHWIPPSAIQYGFAAPQSQNFIKNNPQQGQFVPVQNHRRSAPVEYEGRFAPAQENRQAARVQDEGRFASTQKRSQFAPGQDDRQFAPVGQNNLLGNGSISLNSSQTGPGSPDWGQTPGTASEVATPATHGDLEAWQAEIQSNHARALDDIRMLNQHPTEDGFTSVNDEDDSSLWGDADSNGEDGPGGNGAWDKSRLDSFRNQVSGAVKFMNGIENHETARKEERFTGGPEDYLGPISAEDQLEFEALLPGRQLLREQEGPEE